MKIKKWITPFKSGQPQSATSRFCFLVKTASCVLGCPKYFGRPKTQLALPLRSGVVSSKVGNPLCCQ